MTVADSHGTSKLYFRQLLAGVDFARDDPVARQMVNFVYLVGDRDRGEAVIVDPAYGIDELLETLELDGMRCVGALATHYHPDHVGGDLMGSWHIEGITTLLERTSVPIHAHEAEVPWIRRSLGVEADVFQTHSSGDVVEVGDIAVTLIHTPGHTPGSQCFLVEERLISGDTLFLEGCGRTDLPGSDPDGMYLSLTQRLAAVPDDTVLYPGHRYSAEPSQPLGETRRDNYVFRLRTAEQWHAMFG